MFDSKAMVEHSEEQPASEAAMMASIIVGRASSSISSSGGGPPPKTVSQVVNEKNDRWYCAKEWKVLSLDFGTGRARTNTVWMSIYYWLSGICLLAVCRRRCFQAIVSHASYLHILLFLSKTKKTTN